MDNNTSIVQRLNAISHAVKAPLLAEMLQLDLVTVYKMARLGELPSYRIGYSVRFDPREVAKWLQASTKEVVQ